jgi:hypothetical protein
MPDDLSDDFLDQMPFTVQLQWEGQLIELIIVPYWDEKTLDSSFTVLRGETDLGVLRHMDSTDDRWEWVSGDLASEKADLIGRQIDKHYFGH